MRKVVFKLGLVPTPEMPAQPLGLLQAAAETDLAKPPREHWLTLSSQVKTLLSVSAVAIAFVTQHTLTQSAIAVLQDAQKTVVHRADLQAEQINLLRNTIVPRDQYDADASRQNAVNLQLANNQQQILLLLARNAAAGK